MQLPVPDIEKQKAIVKEYNTIVNRIKLNEQLNQKLEETAQAIYKEWFVDFEFPMTKEYAESIGKPELEGKAYKANGGEMVWNEVLEKEIPVGWRMVPIKEFVFEMKSGGTPRRETLEYWNSKDIPWLKTGELNNKIILEAEEYISFSGCKNSSAKKLPINAVLIAMYGQGDTKGKVGFLKFEATTNQACCAMICDNIKLSCYLYYFFRINRNEIVSIAIGGAQPNLSKAIIEELQIIKPKHELFEKHHFEEIINYRGKIEKENMILSKIKDMILSKMIKA
jgi:type I restriction enzyme S subunit